MLALCATMPFVQAYEIHIWNKAGKRVSLFNNTNNRICFCLKNTETAKIFNKDGGTLKMFSTSDCTGNYVMFGLGQTLNNADWINSVSFGNSGPRDPFPNPPTCPNYFDNPMS
jgi:hypothetical protein